jgi:hypothetical protein
MGLVTALEHLRRAAHRDAFAEHRAFVSAAEMQRRDRELAKAALAYAAEQGWRAPEVGP